MLHHLINFVPKCNNHLVSFIKVEGLFVSYIVDIFDIKNDGLSLYTVDIFDTIKSRTMV